MDNNTEPQATELEITNLCSCEVENEETGESEFSSECFGCFDDDKQYFQDEFLEPYLLHKGWTEETLIRVYGESMGWTGSNGWTDTKAKDLLDALSINGDYTLRISITPEKEMVITRSSHDEYRTTFRFDLSPEQEYSDE